MMLMMMRSNADGEVSCNEQRCRLQSTQPLKLRTLLSDLLSTEQQQDEAENAAGTTDRC